MTKVAHRHCSTHDRIGLTVVYIVAGVLVMSVITGSYQSVTGDREPSEFIKSMGRESLIALLGLLTKVTLDGRRAGDASPPAGTEDDPVTVQGTNDPGAPPVKTDPVEGGT